MQNKLSCLRVSGDVGGETDGRRTLARSELTPRHQMVNVLQQLRLAGTGVSAQQDVHFSAEVVPALRVEVLLGAAEKLQQNAFFDVFIFVDVRRQSMSHPFVNVVLLRQLLQLANALLRKLMIFAAKPKILINYIQKNSIRS